LTSSEVVKVTVVRIGKGNISNTLDHSTIVRSEAVNWASTAVISGVTMRVAEGIQTSGRKVIASNISVFAESSSRVARISGTDIIIVTFVRLINIKAASGRETSILSTAIAVITGKDSVDTFRSTSSIRANISSTDIEVVAFKIIVTLRGTMWEIT